jgi:hypothetical protein
MKFEYKTALCAVLLMDTFDLIDFDKSDGIVLSNMTLN